MAPYMGLGMQMAAAVALCAGLGWWLDERYGTAPWCLTGGAFFGAVSGLTNLIRTALKDPDKM